MWAYSNKKVKRKSNPDAGLNYSANKSLKQPMNIQKQKVLEFLAGNQQPKSFNYRQKEIQQIAKCIQEYIDKRNKNKYRVLMITGPSASGKTISVNHVLQKLQKKSLKVIRVNANIIKTVRDVQYIIYNQILGGSFGDQLSTLQIIRDLEQRQSKTKYILCIQQVDIILLQKTNIFTQDFFCLFSNPKLNITLLGISSTIDSMERYSKNVSINLNEIKNIVFEPYPDQILMQVMKQKIEQIENRFKLKIIIPNKIFAFIVTKINSMNKGDVRLVLNFLKEVANNILLKNRQQSLDLKQENYDVSMSLVQKIFSKMVSSKNDCIITLPETQQIVLIAFYLYFKENDSLYTTKQEVYKKARYIFQILDQQYSYKIVEDGIEMLKQYSLIAITSNKKVKQNKFILKISLNQVQTSLQDKQIFKRFFKTEK